MNIVKKSFAFLSILFFLCSTNNYVSADCSDYPDALFCEDFNDPLEAPLYSFDGYKFGWTGVPWTLTPQSSGGIGNSGYIQATAVNNPQQDCWYGEGVNDGDFYWRGCWKFSEGWDDYGLGDQKLTYIYGTGGNLNLFWHGGGDWPPDTWSRQGLELAHYAVAAAWVPANSVDNEVRHTNYLLLSEHTNRWMCVEHHVDVDQNPWVHTYWVTTEGGTDLPEGTCSRINGRMEFNDYEYIRTYISTDPATYTYIKYGAFTNENVGYETMSLEEFVMSDTKIGPPVEWTLGPECSDGIDNDGDGPIDYPDDPGCNAPEDNNEINGEGILTANYPLKIIQPQSNLDTRNRFYKAYPGLEYNVRVGVTGGLYPYTFSLTTSPSGMAINPSTGEITWPNPTTSGSPHPVSVRVVDSEETVANRSWSIDVTSNGFIFVDSINGINAIDNGCSQNCGDGSLSNPFRTIKDFYKSSKTDSTFQDYFVYFREGTYTWEDCETETSGAWWRVVVGSDFKPVVWLGYPGETPVLDQNDGPMLRFGGGNVWIDGLDYVDMNCFGFQLGATNVVIRNVDFYDLAGWSASGSNCAYIMALTTGSSNVAQYTMVQDCTFDNCGSSYPYSAVMKWYSQDDILLEDSIITNTVCTEGIALKSDIGHATVRNNRIYGQSNHAIGGNMHATNIQTNFEICYNLIMGGFMGGEGYPWTTGALNINQDGLAKDIYIYRNTIEGRVNFDSTESDDGPFYLYNNVIVNEDIGTPEGSHVFYRGSGDSSRVILSDNLVGFPSDNIIDQNGDLTPAYSSYLGTHGYQLSTSPPTTECSDNIDNDNDGDTDMADSGCASTSDNDETNCGDNVCEGGETCTDCPGDCLQAGEQCCSGVAYNPATQVCCSGTVYTGNCCEDANCTSPETCISHVCTPQAGTTVSVDSTYPGYTTDPIDDEVIDPYGAESTTWASEESSTDPHWVAIGFSEPQSINNVTIYWAYNFVMEAFMSSQEVWIQYWNGIDYENVSTITNTGYVEASSTSFDPVTTAGLRLFQPPDSGPIGYSNILWLTEMDYSSSTHRADTNGDGCIDLNELLAFIKRWKVSSQDVPMPGVMEAMGLWKSGTGCS